MEWYSKASDKGSANAQYNIGYCYEKGYGVSQNKEIAINWYKKAMDNGSSSGQEAYERLTYVKPSKPKADPYEKIYNSKNFIGCTMGDINEMLNRGYITHTSKTNGNGGVWLNITLKNGASYSLWFPANSYNVWSIECTKQVRR